jgi:predicted AAA+ superfamily ATPase
MVLLAGARQCGKTTLAKSLLDDKGQYLNWDIVKDRRIIRETAWPTDVYRLHPIDVAESRRIVPEMDLDARGRRLLDAGGFPEAYLRPEFSRRW